MGTGIGAGALESMQPLAVATSTSTGEAVQFWILGTIAVLGALGTVLMRRAVHAALCLAGTMIILAVFYLANGAYFLGVVQIVVYTGAVMMLFLFVLMLVGVSAADSLKETLKGQRWAAAACGVGLGILLISGIAQAAMGSFNGLGAANAGGNVPGLASLLFTKYVVAFEVVGALLTVAAVGATLLTHRERIDKAKSQREQAEERVRTGTQVPPLPAPGVFARHNAVDRPGLLPDGTPSELTVSATLRERGQVREVAPEQLRRVAQLEQRTADRYGQAEPGRMYGEPDQPAPGNQPARNGRRNGVGGRNGHAVNGKRNGNDRGTDGNHDGNHDDDGTDDNGDNGDNGALHDKEAAK